jgi:aspartate kinase
MSALAAEGISVDMMTHADRHDGRRQMQLTIQEADLERGVDICRERTRALGGEAVDVQPGLSKVTLVGSGMTGMPGVYARALQALQAAGVDVLALGTSSVSISFLVDSAREDQTLQTLHAAFDLAKESG